MAKRGQNLDAEIDAIFRLSLAEFTGARNALAKRLKDEGRAPDAERVKALVKPPAPAWAVNQLYWQDSKTIERLMTLGDRVRQAQTGRSKNADLRALLDEKKQLTASLLTKASTILEEAGHAASPDALRRVSMTLESLAASGGMDDAPRAGRLTADLDPPGFDTLAGLMPLVPRPRPLQLVQTAEKALRDAQRDAERAESALALANAHAEELGVRYEEARARARVAASEAKEAAQAVADAERALAKEKKALR